MSNTANDLISEVPANGTDSNRGDYLPTVEPPAGLEEGLGPVALEEESPAPAAQ